MSREVSVIIAGTVVRVVLMLPSVSYSVLPSFSFYPFPSFLFLLVRCSFYLLSLYSSSFLFLPSPLFPPFFPFLFIFFHSIVLVFLPSTISSSFLLRQPRLLTVFHSEDTDQLERLPSTASGISPTKSEASNGKHLLSRVKGERPATIS